MNDLIPTPTNQCRCTMISEQTLEEPSDWEQADDCPVHPLTTPTDPTWLHEAVEAGAGAYDLRAAILAALPEIMGGVAAAAHLPDWCKCPDDCDCDGVLILTEDEVRNFGSEVTR